MTLRSALVLLLLALGASSVAQDSEPFDSNKLPEPIRSSYKDFQESYQYYIVMSIEDHKDENTYRSLAQGAWQQIKKGKITFVGPVPIIPFGPGITQTTVNKFKAETAMKEASFKVAMAIDNFNGSSPDVDLGLVSQRVRNLAASALVHDRGLEADQLLRFKQEMAVGAGLVAIPILWELVGALVVEAPGGFFLVKGALVDAALATGLVTVSLFIHEKIAAGEPVTQGEVKQAYNVTNVYAPSKAFLDSLKVPNKDPKKDAKLKFPVKSNDLIQRLTLPEVASIRERLLLKNCIEIEDIPTEQERLEQMYEFLNRISLGKKPTDPKAADPKAMDGVDYGITPEEGDAPIAKMGMVPEFGDKAHSLIAARAKVTGELNSRRQVVELPDCGKAMLFRDIVREGYHSKFSAKDR